MAKKLKNSDLHVRHMSLLLDEATYNRISEIAESAGMSRRSYVRWIITKHVEGLEKRKKK